MLEPARKQHGSPVFAGGERESIYMVVEYLESLRIQRTRARFSQRFPNSRLPHRSSMLKNVKKYNNFGTRRNRQSEARGRHRTARSHANMLSWRLKHFSMTNSDLASLNNSGEDRSDQLSTLTVQRIINTF